LPLEYIFLSPNFSKDTAYEATNDGRDFHKNLKYRMAMKIGVTFLDIGKRCRRSREKFEDQKNIFN
jgi:hypothetical protein